MTRKHRITWSGKWTKRSIAFFSDLTATTVSWLGAGWLTSTPISESHFDALCMAGMVLMQEIVCITGGLYRGVWRFASIPDLIRILRAVFLGSLIAMILLAELGHPLSVRIYILYILLLTAFLSCSRLIFRWLRDHHLVFFQMERTLIVGAGNAGESIIRDLYRSSTVSKCKPVALVDDDLTKQGCEIRGVRIVGPCRDISRWVTELNIDLILIAIPSASSRRMREIVRYCEESQVPFRTLPSLKQIADGRVTVHSLRPVAIEDLLGREPVDLDWQAIGRSIRDRTVLVTGGAGSIGSELCRQIAQLSPERLIVIDNHEFNLYSIDMELAKKLDKTRLFAHLCDVTSLPDIEKLVALYQPELIFHVAAYKHVPLLETHIRAAMYNNIIGTKIVAELADKYHVQSFVLISTDKAVNPASVMGATKRASEIFCQMLNFRSRTRFITVRFGNVLESAGSVIPLFRSQLQSGGPITVTHPEVTRYFMTIPEASQLILQANAMENQGDIFVLEMGEPINIRYLAEQMIKLSGKVVGQDIDIVYTGLRPGEKLYEELFHENENICTTTHPKIQQAKVRHYDWNTLLASMAAIETASFTVDEVRLKKILTDLVPEYQSLSPPSHSSWEKEREFSDWTLSPI